MTPLEQKARSEADDFAKVSDLNESQRSYLYQHLVRRYKAEEIAAKHDVDVGDVQHVLFNLTLKPEERLARSFQRAGLSRYAVNRN